MRKGLCSLTRLQCANKWVACDEGILASRQASHIAWSKKIRSGHSRCRAVEAVSTAKQCWADNGETGLRLRACVATWTCRRRIFRSRAG